MALVLAWAAGGTAAASPAAARCSAAYGYAGLAGRQAVAGVGADVAFVTKPEVAVGHVAAWVGVSAGSSWLQIGISRIVGIAPSLYLEVSRPDMAVPSTRLLGRVAAGRSYALEVRRVDGARRIWQAFLDGRPVGDAVAFSGGGPLLPMVMSESANEGTGSCNVFRFAFAGVRVLPKIGGNWRALRHAKARVDRGYRLQRAGDRFLASSGT